MAQKKVGRRSAMTDEHKAALAEGRTQGRAVRRYLEALENYKPKRGRKRTPESIRSRLNAVERAIQTAHAEELLLLTQERMDLQNELNSIGAKADLSAFENSFVDVAKEYSARKGISYAAWREVGVDPRVLKRAGISRARS